MPQDKNAFQQQFNTQFQQALALQQEKKWDDAVSKYQSLLDQGLNNLSDEQASALYYNLSAIAYEKGDFLQSYIWSKKSVSLNSENSFAKQISAEILKKYQPVQIPHQISTVESLQKITLKNVSIDILLVGFLVFFGLTIFMALKSLLMKKKNQIESENESIQKKYSIAPLISFFSFLIVSCAFLFLVVIKWTDLSVPKAIVARDNTSVQTASGADQAVIYTASAGLEVDILKIEADYVQIRYPGAFSGWVLKKNLELLSSTSWPSN